VNLMSIHIYCQHYSFCNDKIYFNVYFNSLVLKTEKLIGSTRSGQLTNRVRASSNTNTGMMFCNIDVDIIDNVRDNGWVHEAVHHKQFRNNEASLDTAQC